MQEETDFLEFCNLLLMLSSNEKHLFTGSVCELPIRYTVDNFTDADLITYRRDICAVPFASSNPASLKGFKKGLILKFSSAESHKGFTKLYKSQVSGGYEPYSRQQFRSSDLTWPAYTNMLFQRSDAKVFFDVLRNFSKQADNFDEFYLDRVDAIFCPLWPEEANEWGRRKRRNGWPSAAITERVISSGCFLVAKPHQGNPNNDYEWRFSFSLAELFLIQSWNDIQKYIYHIIRLVKNDVVKKCGGKEKTVLSTYHFKTLMLWACEEKPREFWSENNTRASVVELLCNMIEWLIDKQCSNYFIPDNNMIDYLPQDQDFTLEVQHLLAAVCDINSYLDSTIPLYKSSPSEEDQLVKIYVPNKLFSILQLCFRWFYNVDPSAAAQKAFKAKHPIENTNLIRYETGLKDLYDGLRILVHLASRSYGSAEERKKNIEKAKACFKRAIEREISGCTKIDILLSDNLHSVLKKFLRTTAGFGEEQLFLETEYAALKQPCEAETWDIFKWLRKAITDKPANNDLISISASIASQMVNQKIESPLMISLAAYAANFYYAGLEHECSVENYEQAKELCKKGFDYYGSADRRLPEWVELFYFFLCRVILTNKWSLIFDKHIQTLLGFITVYNAYRREPLLSRSLVRSTTHRSRDVYIFINALDFCIYINVQCDRKLVESRSGERTYENNEDVPLFKKPKSMSQFLLCTAARIS